MQLRDYQTAAIEGVRDAFRQRHRRVLLVAPTGAGKTVMFSYLANAMSRQGHRVLLLAHREELLQQISATLQRFAVPHGFIAARRPVEQAYLVQVAGVHTLKNRTGKLIWQPDWIICDEAHHATAGSWKAILDAYPKARVIGVTATPCRLDGTGLGDVFDHMVIGPQVADLIAAGYLSKVRYFCPATVDASKLKMRMGEYKAGDVDAAVNIPRVTGEAVAYYQKLCDGQPAVAFCASIKHSEHVAETFRAAGYRWTSLDSRMTPQERAQAVRDLGSDDLHGVSSCDIISEGFDLPIVSAAILLRPTASLGLYLQQVGRVLRPAPGKQHATIIDHVGNAGCNRAGQWIEKHGFAGDVREWTLRGAGRRPKAQSVTLCQRCYAVLPFGGWQCVNCGWKREIKERKIHKASDEAELREVEASKRQLRLEMRDAKTLEDWQAIARQRGYKPGWAVIRHRLRMAR